MHYNYVHIEPLTEALDPADYRDSKLCKTQFDVNYVLHRAKLV